MNMFSSEGALTLKDTLGAFADICGLIKDGS